MRNLLPNNSETEKYTFNIPSTTILARDIAAFANTKGGKIFIGVIPNGEGLHLPPFTQNQLREAEKMS